MADEPNDSLYGSLFDVRRLVEKDQAERAEKRAKRAARPKDDRSERDILSAIEQALGKIPGVTIRRYTVGTFKVGDRYISAAVVGHSDLAGSVKRADGCSRPLFLEVKTRVGQLRPAQGTFLRRESLNGSYCAVVRSVEEALEAVRACREGKPSPTEFR